MTEIARVTINDIARQAGLSKGAVSYALNGKPGVSEETRERVAAIALQLGWTPNQAARSLSLSRADAIGLVLSRPARILAVEPFYMEFISGIEDVIASRGITLLLHVADDPEQVTATYEKWWGEGRVDGVILTDLATDDHRLETVRRIGLPAVCVGGSADDHDLARIWSDDPRSVRDAVEYLVELGHHRIARVAGTPAFAHIAQRNRVYRETVAGLGFDYSRVVDTDFSGEAGARATRELLTSATRPTAIIFDNDIMAVAALGVAAELGLSIPSELSLLAWDDSALCEITNPSLSAMHRDVQGLGGASARLLLNLIESGESEAEEATRPILVARGSTGPLS